MVRVKICGITSASDAVLAADAGAAAVGLNFYRPSPRCVSVDQAETIVSVIPTPVWRVGVFVDAPREFVEAAAERLRLDAVQFHGQEDAAYCRGWRQKVIKAVRARGPLDVERAAALPVDFVLVDAYVEGLPGGTGQRVPLEWLSAVDRPRLILAGGLTPENVAEAVRHVRPMFVDVASGVERAPGQKDPEKVRRFIANAQSA